MLEKIAQIVEQMATNVSRRQFVGRLGRGAMGVTAAMGGWVACASGHCRSATPNVCGGLAVRCVPGQTRRISV